MSEPFQFSIRRMFGVIALICVAVRLFGLFLVSRYDPSVYTAIQFLGCFAAGGAAIGCAEGRSYRGAIVGVLVAIALAIFTNVLGTVVSVRE